MDQIQLQTPPEAIPVARPEMPREEEVALRKLIDPHNVGDFESAVEMGVIDAYAPGAIRHILAGEARKKGSFRSYRGFHHVPSAQDPSMRINAPALKKWAEEEPKRAVHLPYHPFDAPSIVAGHHKGVYRKRQGRQTVELDQAASFFPDEYDALTVLASVAKAVREGTQTRAR